MKKILFLSFMVITGAFAFSQCKGIENKAGADNSAPAQTAGLNAGSRAATPQPGKKLDAYRLDKSPAEIEFDGRQIKPVQIALDSFLKDAAIPQEKRNLDKYRVELRQDDEVFMVTLTVKRDPNKAYAGGETEDGIDVTYIINKKDPQKITKVLYK